jgi:hypothetical protein
MIPVKGHVGLYRDENSNAIINNNDSIYKEYIKSRDKLIEDSKKLIDLENEIIEIKLLLKKVLENK